jgi:hypothetical protein
VTAVDVLDGQPSIRSENLRVDDEVDEMLALAPRAVFQSYRVGVIASGLPHLRSAIVAAGWAVAALM